MRRSLIALVALGVVGCTQTDTMRVSQNEMIVNTSAAPVCGGSGAAKVALRVAAIETLKAGYDRYLIVSANRANSVHAVQTPGSFYTTGSATSFGSYTSYQANTVYQPGPVVIAGSHDQSIQVRMFKEGEPGAASALSAREALGPDWQKAMRHKVLTCGDQ